MAHWKLTLAYDGTSFHGWQIQPGLETIQGHLQSALHRITGEAPLPQGSGRTDAGVHALAQVASFTLTAPVPPDNLLRALNRTLPAAIRILTAEHVPPGFHARHSAIAKTYQYRIYQGDICSPFLAPYVHACRWPLSLDLLQQAAQALLGTHDFVSFAASDSDLVTRSRAAQPSDDPESPSPIRTLFASSWTQLPDSILLSQVRGSGFLHHMVRNLIGTMLEIARGQFPPGCMPALLQACSRSAAGPTAPARGLFLHSVEYPTLPE